MGGLQTGGGTSAVAASTHAGCGRFRGTDPFLTGRTRSSLAAHLGHQDSGAGIPEARWMRAMTFESLVHADRFVSELLTRTVGQLGLSRPAGIRRRDCRTRVDTTAMELAAAHQAATTAREATMLTALAVPYVGLEGRPDATPVRPDFAIVCPREVDGVVVGSWLVMGDAKDYERVRSQIGDHRYLKGFLQVALGAESAEAWSARPIGMLVHRSGALAVPRNAFLQPESVIEQLDDHRAETRARAEQRLELLAESGEPSIVEKRLGQYVDELAPEFDPATCRTCNLYIHCRQQLRDAGTSTALLTELGVPKLLHGAVAPLVDDATRVPIDVAHSIWAPIVATTLGEPFWRADRRRTDPAGLPGTIDVVLVKSDAGALGVHGIAVRRHTAAGAGTWSRKVFGDPLAPTTRRGVMRRVGSAIQGVLGEGAGPVHLVMPDDVTADVLASIADSLAGVELSRLRWQRDLEQDRPALTFDGEPATIPEALTSDERLAVSFLLEQDRARALRLRTPVVNLRAVLAEHLVPGGPLPDAGRLDYLVAWATAAEKIDHRALADSISERPETPGARLSNTTSDAMHRALRSPADMPGAYATLVDEALGYRTRTLEQALAVLADRPTSKLRSVHRELERDAQEVWLRRVRLQASDLVRFSRTYVPWRNAQVDILDADERCAEQLRCLADPSYARDRALDAGVRHLAVAEVVGVAPLRLHVRSRRIVAGTAVVALHIGGESVMEADTTTLMIQKGSFKVGELAVGPLEAMPESDDLSWSPRVAQFEVGQELVVAEVAWFGKLFASGHELAVKRPSVDSQAAPKIGCGPSSYLQDPEAHRWCCRPHSASEAEHSDELAARRERGELNPQVWPPIVDEDRFDVGPVMTVEAPEGGVPSDLTLDDLE